MGYGRRAVGVAVAQRVLGRRDGHKGAKVRVCRALGRPARTHSGAAGRWLRPARERRRGRRRGGREERREPVDVRFAQGGGIRILCGERRCGVRGPEWFWGEDGVGGHGGLAVVVSAWRDVERGKRACEGTYVFLGHTRRSRVGIHLTVDGKDDLMDAAPSCQPHPNPIRWFG